MITLGNGQVCYTKGEVSLDLRLLHGMTFKTHLQVINAETTYDILLGMDCYRTQAEEIKVIQPLREYKETSWMLVLPD